jgi:hypothetical protein
MGYIDFIVEDEGNPVSVRYDEYMTVENFMKDFLKKHTNYVTLDSKIYTFKTNGKVLNMDRFLRKKLQDIVKNGSRIIFSRKKDTTYSKEI